MKSVYVVILVAASLTAASAQAQRATQPVDPMAFAGLNGTNMNAGTFYYNDNTNADLPTFDDWDKASPVEKSLLVLYPNYSEPKVTATINGIPTPDTIKLRVFVARAKVLLNKAPDAVDLRKMLDVETIKRFDDTSPEDQNEAVVDMRPITADKIMPVVVGHGPIPNFQWCNEPNAIFIAKPQSVTDLKSTTQDGHAWCTGANTVCVESCVKFKDAFWSAVDMVNLVSGDDQKDHGMAMEFEVRTFKDEKELGLSSPLAKLTGVNAPIHGGAVESIFYVNQMIQYGKVITVLQESPADPSKTVMTTFLVAGVKAKNYDKLGMKEALLGNIMGLHIGTKTGITAGLPTYAQAVVQTMAAELEK